MILFFMGEKRTFYSLSLNIRIKIMRTILLHALINILQDKSFQLFLCTCQTSLTGNWVEFELNCAKDRRQENVIKYDKVSMVVLQ